MLRTNVSRSPLPCRAAAICQTLTPSFPLPKYCAMSHYIPPTRTHPHGHTFISHILLLRPSRKLCKSSLKSMPRTCSLTRRAQVRTRKGSPSALWAGHCGPATHNVTVSLAMAACVLLLRGTLGMSDVRRVDEDFLRHSRFRVSKGGDGGSCG